MLFQTCCCTSLCVCVCVFLHLAVYLIIEKIHFTIKNIPLFVLGNSWVAFAVFFRSLLICTLKANTQQFEPLLIPLFALVPINVFQQCFTKKSQAFLSACQDAFQLWPPHADKCEVWFYCHAELRECSVASPQASVPLAWSH